MNEETREMMPVVEEGNNWNEKCPIDEVYRLVIQYGGDRGIAAYKQSADYQDKMENASPSEIAALNNMLEVKEDTLLK